MSVRVICPRCDFVVERPSEQSLPSHCPACGSRVTCPQCGSTLERSPAGAGIFRCSHCRADLAGGDTRPLVPGVHTQADFLPAVPGFEIRGELGRGGMGIVYRAWQQSLKREVALKALPPVLAANPKVLGRFRNEAAVAARLVDSHLLPVFDVQEVQGVPVIVMPLIEGTDLGRVVKDRREAKRGKMPEDPHPWALLDDRVYLERVLPVLDQVVDAVAALHRAGVLHRDVKPSNVLVDRRGSAWLGDFGLARLAEQGVGTRTGVGLGTRGYASPEQERGEDIDRRADLFSLGATLYQALTGELPFGKGTAHVQAPPTPPSRRQPALPRTFDAVLLKALEPAREGRYATAGEMREDWRRARQGLLPRARMPGPWTRARHAAWRHRGRVLAAVVGAALVLLLGAIFLPRLNPVPPAADAPATPTPPAPVVRRTVRLETDPPGARVVLVPLHQQTGEPLPESAIRPERRTPLAVAEVPVGQYLVVAEVAGRGFHEVYRTVPRPGQVIDRRVSSRAWEEQVDGAVALPPIVIPAADVTRGMAFFKGKDFTMGSADLPGVPPHRRHVDSFYLDPTEVTVGAYRAVKGDLPVGLLKVPPPDSYAVDHVLFDHAVDYAERIGKRLPDEAEYEFAATQAGTTRFPWGDDERKEHDWRVGPVRSPAYDKTPTDPPVYGLFSNVLEWTSSWHTQYPGVDPAQVARFYAPEMQMRFAGTRLVRGGPSEVLDGAARLAERDRVVYRDPRWRFSESVDRSQAGLGFRCARSAQPRFLQK